MKKLLGILAISALAASAFAQGTVVLGNQTGLVKQWTSAADSTLISVPKSGGYVFLVAAPVGTALPNPLYSAGKMNYSSLAGFLSANPGWATPNGPVIGDTTSSPGLIAAAAGVFNAGTYTINNVAGGASASYLLLGWTGSFTSVDSAITAWNAGQNMFGESAIATTPTGNPGATPVAAAVSLKSTFAGMTLAPGIIPEPSTFALAGLGAAAMLIFRRRK